MEDARFHRADTDSHDFGDLGIRQFFLAEQQQRLTLGLGQGGDGLLHLDVYQQPVRGVIGRQSVVAQAVHDRRRRVGVDGHVTLVTPATPQRVIAQVACDAEGVRSQVIRPLHAVERAEKRDERFLHQIFPIAGLAGQPPDIAGNRRLERGVQLPKGVGVTALRRGQPLFESELCEIRHLAAPDSSGSLSTTARRVNLFKIGHNETRCVRGRLTAVMKG